jgi:hypothetical protein
MTSTKVREQLYEEQAPLGTQFKSYELNAASNYWTLDPFQYSITKFQFNFPDGREVDTSNSVTVNQNDFQNYPGLVYRDVNFENLLPSYTQTKRSVNDFPAQSYHRFEANDGYFNPNESNDNSDLWYYGADENALKNGVGLAGNAVNVQETNHIIFPEAQRGGLDSRNVAKYSWSPGNIKQVGDFSWEGQNAIPVNNNERCEFFNWNNKYSTNFVPSVYSFDSDYCRDIGISPPTSGSMPYSPHVIK